MSVAQHDEPVVLERDERVTVHGLLSGRDCAQCVGAPLTERTFELRLLAQRLIALSA